MAWWPGADDAYAAQSRVGFPRAEEVGTEYVAFGPIRPCTISLLGIVDIGR